MENSDYYRDIIERLMDQLVERWHQSDCVIPIHEYCGLTWEEYSKWVQGIL